MTQTASATAFAFAPAPVRHEPALRDLAPLSVPALVRRSNESRVSTDHWSKSPAMVTLRAMLERMADSDVGVLLRGESGVGKEVVARELHERSPRRDRPFVKVNCAALPADLLESELFGHERGAFTGAWAARAGLFEAAQHGTIMLDEIGEMPAVLQAKILHVVQDGAFTRLGGNRTIAVDVRIIAATNRDLEAMIRAGTFREDLYYRLQVIELLVPPLRERPDEIAGLAMTFLTKYAAEYRRPAVRPSAALLGALAAHDWPGNIRELENTMKRCVVLQDESMVIGTLRDSRRAQQRVEPPVHLTVAVVPAGPPRPLPPVALADASVALHAVATHAALDAERHAILDALTRFQWNRRKASVYLNVSYKTLLNKIKACGITMANAA